MKPEANSQSRTFRGKTMAEALDQVKRQFGRDAVILHTRTVSKGRFLGVRGRECIEITASRGMAGPLKPFRTRGACPGRGAADPTDGALRSDDSQSRRTLASADPLLTEIGVLKNLVTDLARETRRAHLRDLPGPLYDTYVNLVQNEVAEQLARQLIDGLHKELERDQLQDPERVKAHLAAAVEAMLPTAGPVRVGRRGEPTIVALVGPTGVGKTTTVAKLAANFRLREQRKVGLITLDTYRIAAVTQLKTYAEIIDVPLEVVMAPEQLRDAVAKLEDRDVILIDTAGRSQRDALKIRELQRFFGAVRPHEVHLVLSGTAGERVMAETIERFRGIGIDRVIFTKLDEAVGFGVILSCLDKAKARLSYITTGQDVPDDIAVAEGRTLARLIAGEGASVGAECGNGSGPKLPV